MAKQLRVHTLAKELSVSSKDIIEKCRAEGIELPNHMAAISIGLAESIREWFSVGADVTSVEAAAPVDLKKVRKPRARPKLAAEPLSEGPTEVAEPPASETAAPAPAPPLPAIETPAPPPAQPAV
ncbi:MAG: translation initiation factor IF-2 N-terminal domain-containing protein, partial [Phycisphaerae bacterium]|nr:translation initiation factor IF-2 N-terminal domain-containing protein [Phycisphaerae bacterium]